MDSTGRKGVNVEVEAERALTVFDTGARPKPTCTVPGIRGET